MDKKLLAQALKYGIVGVMNTLLTAVIIWVMLRCVFLVYGDSEASPVAMTVANLVGYTVGLINSFIFNRNWTFKSKDSWKMEFLRFLLAFGICYLIQLGLVLFLNSRDLIPAMQFDFLGKVINVTSAYSCQLIGIVSYTFLNFFLNKYFTFKSK